MNSIFKALNDETRRKILKMLKEKDMNAGEIAEKFNMSKPSISHHLDILKRADLITGKKEGQFIIYTINTTVVDDLFQWIYNLKLNHDEKSDSKRDSFLDINSNTDSLLDQ
ncbi:MAG: winged helix-turn-helix transcriptional regulator [Flavobacteriaceae bacterium]|nr:winged helix-turn-helix transcriptional regulator [Flavobacteriaceae bacterium]